MQQKKIAHAAKKKELTSASASASPVSEPSQNNPPPPKPAEENASAEQENASAEPPKPAEENAQVTKANQKNTEPATEQEQANASASASSVSEADPPPKKKKRVQQEQANASASPSPVPAATTPKTPAFVRRSKRSAAAAHRVTTGGVKNCHHCKRICNYDNECPGCKRTFHVACMLSMHKGHSKMCIPCFEKRRGHVKELDSHDVDQWSPGVYKPYHPFTKKYAMKTLNMQVHMLT
jgi:hypothetical protein